LGVMYISTVKGTQFLSVVLPLKLLAGPLGVRTERGQLKAIGPKSSSSSLTAEQAAPKKLASVSSRSKVSSTERRHLPGFDRRSNPTSTE